jgi:hypothetical protein
MRGDEMALRGKKPSKNDKRLKLLLYGKAGVGKTTACIQFPKVYLIDTEKGATNDQYVDQINQVGGAYFFTNDPHELIAEVTSLLSEKHDYKTLVIDPLTTIYNDLCMASQRKIAMQEGKDIDAKEVTAFSRPRAAADRHAKHLIGLLTRLDMNVIITSHAKAQWDNGAPTGKDTFDCYSKLDYLFDLAVEVQKRGKERVGVVRKSRVLGFDDNDVFPFSYDEVAVRYGREVLEKESVPVVLATPAQVEEIHALLSERKDGQELSDKWLSKADAEAWNEVGAAEIEKAIHFLKNPTKKGVGV